MLLFGGDRNIEACEQRHRQNKFWMKAAFCIAIFLELFAWVISRSYSGWVYSESVHGWLELSGIISLAVVALLEIIDGP
jgi:hypothetical protein